MRTSGVPIWVSIITLLLGLLGTTLGMMAFFKPDIALGYIEGADTLAITWAGRNPGLGLALLMAVFLRSREGYVIALCGSLFREISDMVATGVSVALAVFFLVELVCFEVKRHGLSKAHWRGLIQKI